MSADYWNKIIRGPRHDSAAEPFVVEMRRSELDDWMSADLDNLSRQGLKLTVSYPLLPGEAVELRWFEGPERREKRVRSVVRWRRRDGDRWHIGCLFASPLEWETMGELFLSSALSGGECLN